jgi:hypothetical protein
MHWRFPCPFVRESSFSSCTCDTDTYFHKRLDHRITETWTPLTPNTSPCGKKLRRFAMASSLLNFVVWDGSANIAARHSSIRPIGSKVKIPAWSCLTSSSANIAMWKLVTSDCILRKSLFGIALAPEATAAREKNRLCGDRKATAIEVYDIEAPWQKNTPLPKLAPLSTNSF